MVPTFWASTNWESEFSFCIRAATFSEFSPVGRPKRDFNAKKRGKRADLGLPRPGSNFVGASWDARCSGEAHELHPPPRRCLPPGRSSSPRKLPPRHRPGSQPPAFPAAGPHGDRGAPPERTAAGDGGTSPALLMAPTLPGGVTVASRVLGRAPGLRCGSLPKAPDLPLAPGAPEKGNRLGGGGGEAEAGRNGVRGGTKLPPRVADSAPSGLAPPGGGPTGAASLTRWVSQCRGPEAAPAPAHYRAVALRGRAVPEPSPPGFPPPGRAGALSVSGPLRGGRLTCSLRAQTPSTLASGNRPQESL